MNEKADCVDTVRDWVQATLDDMKAEKVVVLDVRGRTTITDLMVFASGNSRRHVKSIADHLQERGRADGRGIVGVEGAEGAEWILVDLNDAVVHVMSHEMREFYRLENIWGVEDDEAAAAERRHGR